MNQDTDKEIEILLRRNARRGASVMSGAMEDERAKSNAARAEAHMDADELSAYAEGALPERARSRYAAHLADCDSCRKVVADLVIASNVASNIEAEEKGAVAQTVAEPKRSWREWFGSLFSPPVLRFAVPALALILISAIVFIVVTRRSADEASLVAKNQEPRNQTSTSNVADQRGEASSNDEPVSANNHGNTATSNASTTVETNTNATSQQKQPAETNATTPPAPPPQPQQNGAVAANAPKAAAAPVAEQPAVEQERKEAQSGKPAPTNEPSDKVLDRTREKDEELAAKSKPNEEAAGGAVPATSDTQAPANGRRSRSNTGTVNSNAVGAASEATSDDRRRNETAKSLPSSRAKRDAAGADVYSTSTSTRTVAGKRFRQQNGIWIDTAYNSSRSLTTVRRGTEQYRALVADEPIIATAANELGNCIIVVKGRAYHVY